MEEEEAADVAAGLVVRRLEAGEVAAAHKLEALSYPEDEAASLEGMIFRQTNAPQFFYGLFEGGDEGEALLGFVNGTCCVSEELHHDTMSQHDPAGSTLCIHSVVIRPERRRQGLATAMLKQYTQRVLAAVATVVRVRLIAKAHNLGLYQRCGFRVLRLSPVVHGQDPWFEMGLDRLSVLESGWPFVQVDAFTDRPFGGNPAAVVFGKGGETAEWMQSWAGEINLSETSFLTKIKQPAAEEEQQDEHVYSLRWFTPLVEVDLCGHATLASAHALWATGRVPPRADIAFKTKSGRLLASRQAPAVAAAAEEEGVGTNDGCEWIWLDFPAEPASPMTKGPENYDWQLVYDAFLCEDARDIVYIGRNRVDVLVVLTRAAFHRLAVTTPNTTKLAAVECRGIIATCRAEPGDGPHSHPPPAGGGAAPPRPYDFLSRFFAPRCGISEDPVTGSAHCCLAAYWAAELNKTSLRAHQASKRGGELRIHLDKARGRVCLGGKAVLVKHGFLGC